MKSENHRMDDDCECYTSLFRITQYAYDKNDYGIEAYLVHLIDGVEKAIVFLSFVRKTHSKKYTLLYFSIT